MDDFNLQNYSEFKNYVTLKSWHNKIIKIEY